MVRNAASFALLALSVSLRLAAAPSGPNAGPAGESDSVSLADPGGSGFGAARLSRKPYPERGQPSDERMVDPSIWYEREVGSSSFAPEPGFASHCGDADADISICFHQNKPALSAESETWVSALLADDAPYCPGHIKGQLAEAFFPAAERGAADLYSYPIEDDAKTPSRVPELGSTLGMGLLGLAVVILLKRLK